jgi:hypothetical protein
MLTDVVVHPLAHWIRPRFVVVEHGESETDSYHI